MIIKIMVLVLLTFVIVIVILVITLIVVKILMAIVIVVILIISTIKKQRQENMLPEGPSSNLPAPCSERLLRSRRRRTPSMPFGRTRHFRSVGSRA